MSDTQDLKVGDEIEMHYGPYKAVCEVVEVNERGAVIAPPFNAVLVGFDKVATAPDGTELTKDRALDFLGRAHFAGAKVVRRG